MTELSRAPSTARNKEIITEVLRPYLPGTGTLLEIASGYGEHAVHLAENFPGLEIQPSDRDPGQLTSAREHRKASALDNVRPPICLDASGTWPQMSVASVLAINMIHISPWAACEGLFRNAAKVLSSGGRLFTYGPYFCEDIETAASNIAFDESLRGRNPEWGIRELDRVRALADEYGFDFEARHDCEANNFVCVFIRR